MVDYRKLRFNNIKTDEYKHVLWLLYWPVYCVAFCFIEKCLTFDYTAISCGLDDKIPFCEYFFIPYILWYAYLVFIHIYTLLFDVPRFKKLMSFFIIAFSLTLVIYILFPNKQELRVTEFPRDNFLTDLVKGVYLIDTNTNVCPSLHVIGSFAVLFASWNCKGMDKYIFRVSNVVITLVICISTVFLKQHSVIDVFFGAVLSFLILPIVYILPIRKK